MATVVGAVTSSQAVTLATEHAATATTPAAVIARLRMFMMTCPRVLCGELT
jgi:hypothetical protein